MIEEIYEAVVDFIDDLPDGVKYAGAAGLAVATLRLAQALAEEGNPLKMIADLLALPWELAFSIIGDMLAVVFPGTDTATDKLIGDWSQDGTQQGVIGEVYDLFGA